MLLKRNLITLELRHVEINISSTTRIVPKRLVIFWPTRQPSREAILVTQHKKLGNSTCLITKTKNPVELKRCQKPCSYSIYNLMKLKPQKEGNFKFWNMATSHKTGNSWGDENFNDNQFGDIVVIHFKCSELKVKEIYGTQRGQCIFHVWEKFSAINKSKKVTAAAVAS